MVRLCILFLAAWSSERQLGKKLEQLIKANRLDAEFQADLKPSNQGKIQSLGFGNGTVVSRSIRKTTNG